MQNPPSLIDFVGGAAVIGPVPDRFALIRAVSAGLPVGAVHALVRSGRIAHGIAA